MEYAILFLPLAGSLLGYLGRSLTKYFSEITTSLFVGISAILSLLVFWNGIQNNIYGNYKIFEWISSDGFIANWSISEFPVKFRKKFLYIINKSKYSIISFQENFENINNLKFFNKVKNKLKKKFIVNLHTFEYYNNSPLNKNNHYILTLVRK